MQSHSSHRLNKTAKGNRRQITLKCWERSHDFWWHSRIFPKADCQLFQQTVHHIKAWQTHLSRETRIVSREIKRKSLMSAVTFTTDQFIKGISNCSNTKAFGPDKLSIFHLKNLGPKAIEYLTALYNDSVTSCRIPAICKSAIVIPIPKPGKDSSLGT